MKQQQKAAHLYIREWNWNRCDFHHVVQLRHTRAKLLECTAKDGRRYCDDTALHVRHDDFQKPRVHYFTPISVRTKKLQLCAANARIVDDRENGLFIEIQPLQCRPVKHADQADDKVLEFFNLRLLFFRVRSECEEVLHTVEPFGAQLVCERRSFPKTRVTLLHAEDNHETQDEAVAIVHAAYWLAGSFVISTKVKPKSSCNG
mmetsp:Transcript_101088/g.184492  ORF Transcript_101088/g.184492 Transcript_101088/m.184492 type:complete len:203 (+) Transcript_101088:576-1184(+)